MLHVILGIYMWDCCLLSTITVTLRGFFGLYSCLLWQRFSLGSHTFWASYVCGFLQPKCLPHQWRWYLFCCGGVFKMWGDQAVWIADSAMWQVNHLLFTKASNFNMLLLVAAHRSNVLLNSFDHGRIMVREVFVAKITKRNAVITKV